jgi:PTS system cellobiose-specific IIB component
VRPTIRLLILCSLGMSSAVLLRRVQEAAEKRGIPLSAQAMSAWESPERFACADVILLEPHTAHLRADLEKHTRLTGAKLDVVDAAAFLAMDGDRVLNQVLRLARISSGRKGDPS